MLFALNLNACIALHHYLSLLDMIRSQKEACDGDNTEREDRQTEGGRGGHDMEADPVDKQAKQGVWSVGEGRESGDGVHVSHVYCIYACTCI